jgi:succinate dehydrogenase hydrophobic anchor subunit
VNAVAVGIAFVFLLCVILLYLYIKLPSKIMDWRWRKAVREWFNSWWAIIVMIIFIAILAYGALT